MFVAGQTTIPEVKAKFGSLYLYHLIWRLNLGEVDKETATLQVWLR